MFGVSGKRAAGTFAAPLAADARTGVCFHCATPNPPDARWRATIRGADRVFCCAGCLAVAQAIDAAGLDAFYTARTAPAPRPAPNDADLWTHYDAAPADWSRARGDHAREVSLLVEGLTCGACVWLIERGVGRRRGVLEARVNFAMRRAAVVFDPQRIRLSEILGEIAALGYRAYPYDPRQREISARREAKALLARTAVAWLAMMQVMMLALPAYVSDDGVAPSHQRLLDWASLVLTLPVIGYCAWPFFRGAWRDLRILHLGMDVPVTIGLAAAFVASALATLRGGGAVYYDSVTMFVALILAARYLEATARQRAGAAIERVARHLPATAERCPRWPIARETDVVAAAVLEPGDVILIRPGASVPADGAVVDGDSYVEEAFMTGESRPIARRVGDRVLAGSLNRDRALVVQVEAAGEATRLAAIVRLTERAASARPRVAHIADRAAGWFVAALLALALVTALVWSQVDPARMLAITFALLVVSCPCALSLATPAAIAAATGALARRQVVLARPDALEALSRVTHVVFDKTGTLTHGRTAIESVTTLGEFDRERVLAIAAALEAFSEHPLAQAFRPFDTGTVIGEGCTIVAGHGVAGSIEGQLWRIGRAEFVGMLSGASEAQLYLALRRVSPRATPIFLGNEAGLAAVFACTDTPRANARRTIDRLVAQGVEPLLFSGDRQAVATALGATLGIASVRGDMTPEDKRAAPSWRWWATASTTRRRSRRRRSRSRWRRRHRSRSGPRTS